MIMCPFCGHVLPTPVKDGVANCLNCSRIFDSTPFNRLLSAAWLVRRQNIVDEDRVIAYGFTPAEAAFVIRFVAEQAYCHDDFLKVLEELGVSKIYKVDLE